MADAADGSSDAGLVHIVFSVRGFSQELSLDPSITLGALGAQIFEQTDIAISTMKLLVVCPQGVPL
jgi:hypothetical protein